VRNPDPGRDGRRRAGDWRAEVPDARFWWRLHQIKGSPSTGREIRSLDLSQLGLKLPNTTLGTYPQIFKSPIEVLVGYRQWPKSNLGPGLCLGQKSFHKLPGPAKGPGSRGRVALCPCRACLTRPLGKGDVSLGGGSKPHLAFAAKGRRTTLPPGALRVFSWPLP